MEKVSYIAILATHLSLYRLWQQHLELNASLIRSCKTSQSEQTDHSNNYYYYYYYYRGWRIAVIPAHLFVIASVQCHTVIPEMTKIVRQNFLPDVVSLHTISSTTLLHHLREVSNGK